jgi:hypothetical protein
MREQLSQAGLRVRALRAVSHFRAPLLKRLVPAGLLVALDRLLQPTGAVWQLAPSVMVRCTAAAAGPAALPGAFFRCTVCGSTVLVDEGDALSCTDCGARFAVQGGIYDFKAPLEEMAR